MRRLTTVIVVLGAALACSSPAWAAYSYEVWLSTRENAAANGSIYRYDSSGNLMGSFALASGEHGGLVQLDSVGNVYTGRYETTSTSLNRVVRHTSTGGAVGGEGSNIVYPGVAGSSVGGMWLK